MQRNGPVLKQSPLWSETPTANESSQSDGLACPSSATCEPLWPTPAANGYEQRDLDEQEMTYCYVAVNEHGTFAATVDTPQFAKETAKTIAGWVRKGATVERIPVEEARVRLAAYERPAKRQRDLLSK